MHPLSSAPICLRILLLSALVQPVAHDRMVMDQPSMYLCFVGSSCHTFWLSFADRQQPHHPPAAAVCVGAIGGTCRAIRVKWRTPAAGAVRHLQPLGGGSGDCPGTCCGHSALERWAVHCQVGVHWFVSDHAIRGSRHSARFVNHYMCLLWSENVVLLTIQAGTAGWHHPKLAGPGACPEGTPGSCRA
jgi:hypothetical protein